MCVDGKGVKIKPLSPPTTFIAEIRNAFEFLFSVR